MARLTEYDCYSVAVWDERIKEAIQHFHTFVIAITSDSIYRIELTTTPLPWGGEKYWFTCPRCNRRCAVLYRPFGAKYYACRLCYNLTYMTSHDSRHKYYQLAKEMSWENRVERKLGFGQFRCKLGDKAKKIIREQGLDPEYFIT